MSFGYSVIDFVAVGKLAWCVYKSCREAPESFANISLEVLSLHAIIKEFGDRLARNTLPSSQLAGLRSVTQGCRKVLDDLQIIVDRYHSLGSKSKRNWDRLAWGKENIIELRSRLISNTVLLNTFISTSQITVQNRLEKYLNERQRGRRESSVITGHSLSHDDGQIWHDIRKELEDVGVTVGGFNTNRTFIMKWFKGAVQSGEFAEQPPVECVPNPSSPASVSEQTVPDDRSDSNSADDGLSQSLETHRSMPSYEDQMQGFPCPTSWPSLSPPPLDERTTSGSWTKLLRRAHSRRNSGKWSTSALIKAVRDGDRNALKDQLTHGIPVNSISGKGSPLLHLAARRGHKDIVEDLLVAGVDLEAKDAHGFTALHEASYSDQVDTVRTLLDSGADIEAENTGYQCTPLVVAVNHGAEAAVCLLLEKGANVHYLCRGQRTLLHVAVRSGIFKERIFSLLLQAGGDLNARNQVGRTPLHTAAYHGNSTAVMCMLRMGARTDVVDEWQDTPLHSAARCKSTLVTKILLEYDADLMVRNNSGKMAGDILIDAGLGDLLNLDSDDSMSQC
ncbi:MAG: hypothetical protein Q9213_001021 [Squamulea squamosa]